MSHTRSNYASGAPMEEKVGYSRAVKIDDFVYVGGTTATTPEGEVLFPGDAYGQTKWVFEKALSVMAEAGAAAEDVFRIKIYITDISKGTDAIKAYSEFFKPVKPLCTMLEVSRFFRPEQIVEIELEAMIGARA